jgi:hypothetical protein
VDNKGRQARLLVNRCALRRQPGNLKDLPIALPQLTGAQSGERIAEVVFKTLQEFGIAEIIPVFEYIHNYYEQRVKAYEAVDYNAHDEAPENHLAINLRAAWTKASDY